MTKRKRTLTLELTERDCAIIANALVLCPGAELGDRVGGHDGQTEQRRYKLAKMFDPDVELPADDWWTPKG